MTTYIADAIRDANEDTELDIYCHCEPPIPTGCQTPDGMVCDCGGLIIVDCDEVSK